MQSQSAASPNESFQSNPSTRDLHQAPAMSNPMAESAYHYDPTKIETSFSSANIKLLRRVIDKMTSYQMGLIRSIGFDGILEIPECDKLDRRFSVFLVSLVRVIDKALVDGHSNSAPIGASSFSKIMGVPSGDVIIQPCMSQDGDLSEDDKLLVCVLLCSHACSKYNLDFIGSRRLMHALSAVCSLHHCPRDTVAVGCWRPWQGKRWTTREMRRSCVRSSRSSSLLL